MRMRASVAFLFPLAVVLVSGAVAGVSAPVLAQMAAVKPAAPDWDKLTDQTLAAVKAQYGLSDDQVQKIRPLLRAHLPKMRSLFDSYAGGSINLAPTLLKEYQATRADFKAKVDPILTEPQRQDFMKIRAEFDAGMKKAFIDARLKWFQNEVGVDAAQSEKVRPILTESFDKRLQLFADAPAEPKDPVAAQKAMRIQLQVLQGETDAKLKTVLTPEQMDKYQESAGAMAPADAAKSSAPQPQTH
jgi:Spy/CpxP family protein refolding chaperone